MFAELVRATVRKHLLSALFYWGGLVHAYSLAHIGPMYGEAVNGQLNEDIPSILRALVRFAFKF